MNLFCAGELFAQAPVEQYPGCAVEAVTDSSRYFVVRIEDGNGKALSSKLHRLHCFINMCKNEINTFIEYFHLGTIEYNGGCEILCSLFHHSLSQC